MEYFSCSSQTITSLIQKGAIAPNANGLFDLKTCTNNYIKTLREVASGREETDAKEASLLANVALKKEQTTLAQLRVSREQAQVIPKNLAIAQFKYFFRLFRGIMMQLPADIRILLKLSVFDEEKIEEHIYEKMLQLQEGQAALSSQVNGSKQDAPKVTLKVITRHNGEARP
jgi:phage terminase Nu1 subunit (DNA packaging protein)